MGFWFSKHDLELLDDPIPDALYCKPCRDKQRRSKPLDLEGNPSIDTLASSSQSSQDVAAVTSEPMPCTNGSRHSRLDSFNISTEVDRCDLWKNMVKRLDTSPEVTRPPGEGVGQYAMTTEEVGGYEERVCHPSLALDTNRLSTLEECENEMDSPALLASPSTPKFEGVSSPNYEGVASPPQYHEHWHPNGPHEPWSSTAPEGYHSTAV